MNAYDYEKEKREAIEAGRTALVSLRNAKEELGKAKNWGIIDFLGGDFIAGLVKHSKMGHAKYYMEQARDNLQSFSKELQDVNMNCDLNIETDDLIQFADLFFDGFITDWLVQDRINNATYQVDKAIRMVEDIVDRLVSENNL